MSTAPLLIGRLPALLLLALCALPGHGRAQSALCRNPTASCGGLISPKCQRLGAGAQNAACDPQFTQYRECLRSVAEKCSGAPAASAAGCSDAEAKDLWAEAKSSNDCFGFQAFLASCPAHRLANFAKGRLSALKCVAPPATAAETPPATKPEAPSAPASPAVGETQRRAAQTELRRLRLYRGPIDGDWGPGSQAAMRAFQKTAGRAQDGALDQAGLAALKAAATPPGPARVAPEPSRPRAAGKAFRDCPACPEMVEIPGGAFLFGSPDDEPLRTPFEGPRRRIRIQPFALGKYEVTFAEWDACVADRGCASRPADQGWGRGRRPVVNVSWTDAREFVRWLNRKVGSRVYRLPSDAEWEYAARAGTASAYWWGAQPSRAHANFGKEPGQGFGGHAAGPDRWIHTAPVGQFPPNPFGLHDMHGNVSEWVRDCWKTGPRDVPADGAPRILADCSFSVIRGGNCYSRPRDFRSAAFQSAFHPNKYHSTGFRVARDLPR